MKNDIKSLIEECIESYLRLSESSARIQHVEDLVFWQGSAGVVRALKNIVDMENEGYKKMTIKWDGSPAVVFGRDVNGKFIFTDKGGFSAKSYDGKSTSPDGLQNMLLSRGKEFIKSEKYIDFTNKMKLAFSIVEKATPDNIRGFFIGDILFLEKPKVVDGKFVFKPNVVSYSVDLDSEIGLKIKDSIVGIVIHKFVDLNGSESKVKNLEIFKNRDLFIIPPVTVSNPPVINKTKIRDLLNLIKSYGSSIDRLLDKNSLKNLKITDFPEVLYTYLNSKVDSGLSNLGDDFFKWLKSSKVSDNKKSKIENHINQNKEGFNTMWELVSNIIDIKDDILNQLNKNDAPVKSSIGDKSGGEGYVSSDSDGDIKYVSRSGFSAVNRSAHKIVEGGNVFKSDGSSEGTKGIDRADVFPTVKWLEKITSLKLTDNIVGSAGKKDSSGDIDMIVDPSIITKDELIKKLSGWVLSSNFKVPEFIKKSGDSVHFKTPILGNDSNGYVQSDFIFGEPEWLRWSLRGEENPKFTGMSRHVLLASIAKFKNLKWSYKNGLMDRGTNVTITKNPNDIAILLLGPDSTSSDLNSFSSILAKIKFNKDFENMVSDARETLIKYGIKF